MRIVRDEALVRGDGARARLGPHRLVDVRVPLATYTGWALRSGPQANDGCEAAGQYIPFPLKKADRLASGDPRLSIEERYPNFSSYYFAVTNALNDMIANRLLLPEDANTELNRVLQAGLATGAIKLDGVYKGLFLKGMPHESAIE